MPIYEYKCECGKEKEAFLAYKDYGQPQFCGCGEIMQHKISLSSFKFKSTANQMALDSLNSPSGGFPDGPDKARGQAGVARGLRKPPKTIW